MNGANRVLRIADVIDFEWLVAADGDLTRRHCGVATAHFCSASRTRSEAADSRSQGIFRAWLEARRNEISEMLPGEYFYLPGYCWWSFLLWRVLASG